MNVNHVSFMVSELPLKGDVIGQTKLPVICGFLLKKEVVQMRFCRIWGHVHLNSPFVETAFSNCWFTHV